MNKFNKLSALMVLTIFLVSLTPVALAGNAGNNQPKRLGDILEIHFEEVELPEPGELGEKVEKAFEKATTTIAKVQEKAGTKNVNGDPEKIMERARERITKAKEQYLQAKERYQEAKNKYNEVKDKVNELRNQIKQCAEGECEPKKKEFRSQSKNVLVNLADVVLKTLDKLQSKIEASEDLTEEEKEQLLADLAEQVTAVEDAKATIEEMNGDVTDEEVKEAIAVIKEAWKTTKPQIKIGVGKLVTAKLGNIIVKTEQLEKKFQKIRDRLESQGYDVSTLDNHLDDFNEQLALANENWELAKEKFQEARTAEDKNAAVREAHQYQNKAREYVKQAREEIRNIVREIKQLGNLDEIEDEVEEEEIEE